MHQCLIINRGADISMEIEETPSPIRPYIHIVLFGEKKSNISMVLQTVIMGAYDGRSFLDLHGNVQKLKEFP